MRKNIIFSVLFIFFWNCKEETKIVFTDELLNQYPSDPVAFKEEYGGELIYYQANNQIKEKTANIDKAVIKGDGFQITFWKNKEYYIHLIRITKKNSIKIGNVSVIGKKINEIERIFGPSGETSVGAPIYKGKNTVLVFVIEGGIVKSCDWGYEM
jgi:hypothetical protein